MQTLGTLLVIWKALSKFWAPGLIAALAIQAQAADFTVNTFDTAAEAAGWTRWFGATSQSYEFDGTVNAEPNTGSGSLKATIRFNQPIYGGDNQFAVVRGFPQLDASVYSNLVFDLRWDPASPARPYNDLGYLEYGFRVNGFDQSWLGGTAIPTHGNWMHFVIPIPATLPNISSVSGIVLKMWAGGAGDGLTGTATFWLDNVKLIANEESKFRIVGSGIVLKTPDKQSYELNEIVQLEAIPGRWYRFDHWGDGSTENPHQITVSNDINQLSAYFSPTTAVETVVVNGIARTAPVGMPIVLIDGQLITETVVTNFGRAEITIQTTLTNGVIFRTLDGTKPDILSSPLYAGPFQMSRSAVLRTVAYASDFSKAIDGDSINITIIPTYQVVVSTPGGGHVNVQPTALEYVSNSIVTVSAVADDGWRFLGWLGDVPETNATASVRISGHQCIKAIFGTSLAPINISGNGAVTVTPDVDWYPFGTEVRLFASPDAGHSFLLWSSAGVITNNPLQLIVTAPNAAVSAAFQPLVGGQFSLAVNSDGRGHVSVSPNINRFLDRQNVTLTAIPSPFQVFTEWSGDATGTQNPMTLSMTKSRIITAHFTRFPRLLSVSCGQSSDANPRFLLQGELGVSYLIQRSTNLSSWIPTLSVTNLLGESQWKAYDDSRHQLFFRAISP